MLQLKKIVFNQAINDLNYLGFRLAETVFEDPDQLTGDRRGDEETLPVAVTIREKTCHRLCLARVVVGNERIGRYRSHGQQSRHQ